jgi:phosphate starvation-inducible protein PhoH
MISNLNGVEGIGISSLTDSDIVRNPIIAKILNRLDVYEQALVSVLGPSANEINIIRAKIGQPIRL